MALERHRFTTLWCCIYLGAAYPASYLAGGMTLRRYNSLTPSADPQ